MFNMVAAVVSFAAGAYALSSAPMVGEFRPARGMLLIFLALTCFALSGLNLWLALT